ncbi:MAG: TldD/PmbA family protein [Firmicutes bacterium]|nr:TldD/PmbA family protein [Bacillota bacterium]
MAKEQLLSRLEAALPEHIDAEIIAQVSSEQLTRFSNNTIHQNIREQNSRVFVRVIENGKGGTFITNSLDSKQLAGAVRKALEAAKLPMPRSSQPPLSPATSYKEMNLHDPELSNLTPEGHAQLVADTLVTVRNAKMQASGAFTGADQELALVNTRGLRAWTRATFADFHLVVSDHQQTTSGYGSTCGRRLADLDFIGAMTAAAAKCEAASNPQGFPPGEHTVILEPAAVADLVRFLALIGLNGQALLEGRSPFPKLGEKYLGDNVTIWDDALDPEGLAMPFDFQGVPKRKLNLITKGIVQNVATDNSVATYMEKASTGHGQLPPSQGPLPNHMFMEAGNAMLDDMIVSTKRGILISRFHYVNVLDARQAVLTGVTRDGTLLIEDGKLTRSLKNLRFTESLIRALSRVEMVGDSSKLFGWFWGSVRVPALKIRGFKFNGSE